MDRRNLLQEMIAAGAVVLAGCGGRGVSDPDPDQTPAQTATRQSEKTPTGSPVLTPTATTGDQTPGANKAFCEIKWSDITEGNYPPVALEYAPEPYDETGSTSGDETSEVYHTHPLETDWIKSHITEYNETRDPTLLYTSHLTETLEANPDRDQFGLGVMTLGERVQVPADQREIHGFRPTECEVETLQQAGQIGYVPEFASTKVTLRDVTREDIPRVAALPFVIRVNDSPETGPMDTKDVGDETIHRDGYSLKQFAVSIGNPVWPDGWEASESEGGLIRLFGSADSALERLNFEDVYDENEEEVRAFITETDFATSVLLYIESSGPDSGTREVAVEELQVQDGTIHGRAKIQNKPGVAFEALANSAALVRVYETTTEATMTILDGWGRESEVQAEIID